MIPKLWADQTLSAINYLRSCPSLAGVTFTRTKQKDKPRQVVVDTEPQQLETPVSRRVSILLESWVARDNGTADTAASFALMSRVLYELQRAPSVLPAVVRFDAPVGPRVEKDQGSFEYHEGSLIWVVSE